MRPPRSGWAARLLAALLATVTSMAAPAATASGTPPIGEPPNEPGPGAQAARVSPMAALQPDSDPAAAGRKTLARTLDKVSVFGEEAPAMLGRSGRNLAVYASRSGSLEPIPFQVDERNPFGFLVLDRGEFASQDLDEGAFDENDEVVFLAPDAGDRVGRDSWPPSAVAGAEIEIRDPVDGGLAWAYLFAFPGAPPALSPVDYVSYDPATDEVTSTVYRVGCPAGEDGNRRGYLDQLTVLPGGGGKGVDILDRLKVRFETRILFGLIALEKNEDDFRSRILAWRDGPVRVARRVESALHVMLGIHAPPAAVESLYYRNILEAPNVVDMPFNLGAFVSEVTLRGMMDYGREAVGMRLFCPGCPEDGVALTGKMDEAKRALAGRPTGWHALAGPPGENWATLNRILMGPTLRLDERLHFEDDLSEDAPPESEPGHIDVGRQFFGMTKVKRGVHTFNAFLYFLPGFRMGDERAVLDVIDRPLEVAVRGDGGPAEARRDDADGAPEGEDHDAAEVFEKMAEAVGGIEDYTALLRAYSSAYRGRLLEGFRTLRGKFKKDPRLVAWVAEKTKYNYDDPVDEGTQAIYFGDEGRILARGAGVKRIFGTIELKEEDAAQWWWGESILNSDMWAWVETWRRMLPRTDVACRKMEVAGKTRYALMLTGRSQEALSLRDPSGVGASRVRIKRIRIWVAPERGFLPVRIESYIPGNPEPVAWAEVLELETNVGLTRGDFDLGIL